MSAPHHTVPKLDSPPPVPKEALRVGDERLADANERHKRHTGTPDIAATIERAPSSQPPSTDFEVPENYDPSRDGCHVALKIGPEKYYVFARRLAVEEFRRRRKAGEPDLLLQDVMEVSQKKAEVFHGARGKALRANKGLLLSGFGTDDTDAVAKRILAEGHFE